MEAGQLTERVTISRLQPTGGSPDSFGAPVSTEATLFSVWAHRRDTSDGERTATAQTQSVTHARFTVRLSTDTRGIVPGDFLTHDGERFTIKNSIRLGDTFFELSVSRVDA